MEHSVSINSFLGEDELVTLFCYIPKEDLLKCKLVCKTWWTLISSAPRLRRGWPLIINSRFIDLSEPWIYEVMESKLKYKQLKIGYDTYLSRNARPFWRYLGETVTELEIGPTDHFNRIKKVMAQDLNPPYPEEYFDMISSMPCLRTLKIEEHQSLLKLLLTPGHDWELLERLFHTIDEVQISVLRDITWLQERELNSVDLFLYFMKGLRRLHICDTSHLPIQDLLSFIQKYAVVLKSISLSVVAYANNYFTSTTQEKLVELFSDPKLQLEHLKYTTRDEEYSWFYHLVQLQPSLTSIQFNCQSTLPIDCADLITELTITSYAMQSFEPFSLFHNLKKLEIHRQKHMVGLCWFGHKVWKMADSFEELIYEGDCYKIACQKCFSYLIGSSRSLKKLTIKEVKLNEGDFHEMFSTLKYLTSFNWCNFHGTTVSLGDMLNSHGWKTTTLESLTLNELPGIDPTELKLLCQKCPMISKLCIKSMAPIKSEMIKIVLAQLPLLTELRLTSSFLTSSFPVSDKLDGETLKLILDHARNLKVLSLLPKDVVHDQCETLFQTFDSLYKVYRPFGFATRDGYEHWDSDYCAYSSQ